MRERSIARRLLVSVLLIQTISAIGFIGATLVHERHTRFQAFDVMLRGRADSMLGAVGDADDEADNIILDRMNLQVPPDDVYEVLDGTGNLLGRSANWTGAAAELTNNRDAVFFAVKVGGLPYRLIRLGGVRVVDPGKPNGGTTHVIHVVYGSQTKAVRQEIQEAVVFAALASCLLLFLTGALVSWLLHRSLSPLRELAAEAEGVSAERWSFHAPENARVTKELAPLAIALQSAVSRLERSYEQQRHFVGDAAHELKTGVSVIKSSLQLLTMRRRSLDEFEVGVRRALLDCHRMEETVMEMLMLARLESRASAETHSKRSDFLASATAAAAQLQPFADLRGVRIKISVPEPAHVTLSEEECTLLCSNILMNAIVHSGGPGEVELGARRIGNDMAEFRFEDHGEGIDENVLPHVFERFYRGDPSRARVTGGSGLGLAICKAIVENAGGRIYLESRRGVGTVVTVRLPSAPAEALDPSRGVKPAMAD